MTDNDKQSPDQPESDRPELDDPLDSALESDSAADAAAESAAAASDTFEEAADDLPGTGDEADEDDEEPTPEAAPQLERLQKILAKSGVASRRHAEELITSGRVQVNGKVVTEMGSKADATRDHIRVDGKLLQGSERHRYFMLNKPKGYVTTVSDPEGRPTIMEFFSKTRERLYPVGRLDYLSEGLLLVTNDGELANKLTRAASNVEKTYLVKVSGQPSDEDLDRLRQGVGIQKGKPGSGRVQTAPAEIRPFRPGKPAGKKGPSRPVDNPWYEVVLIEGRNRELRKMFEEIGHHVEKIRRVGYGPLVLDLEPGKTRELEPQEVENLRRASEGKYRKPKSREPRTREFTPRSDRPAAKPRWNERRPERGPEREKARSFDRSGERRPPRGDRPDFTQRPESGGRSRPERPQFRRDSRRDSAAGDPRGKFKPDSSRPNPRFAEDRPQRPPRRDDSARPPFRGRSDDRNRFDAGRRVQRPFQREDRPKPFASRPPRRDAEAPFKGDRPERRHFDQPFAQRPTTSRPKPFASRPPRREGAAPFESKRPEGRRFDRPSAQRPSTARPARPDRRSDRPASRQDRPRFDRPRPEERVQNRPPDRDRNAPPRLDIQPVEDRERRQGNESRPARNDRPAFRNNERTFDRPSRENRGGQQRETRSERPTRPASGQRSSGSRPSGKFKGGKRSSPGGKQGGARSGGGRGPGSRPSGKRPPKRRP